jgi:beta-lactamase class A
MRTLQATLVELGRTSGAAALAVVVEPVRGAGTTVSVEGDRPFHAASTMKVPVLVELERRAAAGDLSLDDTLVVHNVFRSIADGSRYRLDPADDSETGLYALEGERVTLRRLADLAITVSSNLATNLLVDLLGPAAITETMAVLGAPSLVVRRGVEDDAAWAAGMNNEVTARGLATLLLGIARSEVASPAASAEMLAILEAQAFREGIPAGLPDGTRVAHKTGSITGLYHDAGVINPEDGRPYVLVVLTQGLDEVAAAPALVADVARAVHAAVLAAPS